MTSVFISYSRRDKTIAEVIAAELRNRGAEVFIDYQELVAGESFVGRLGREIEMRDWVVFLVSPRSVESKWVQGEIAWAFTSKKPIIPVLLEPATMVDFFFLINVEQVDFTRWSLDGDIRDAIRKLALALKLPSEPMRTEPVPEITPAVVLVEEPRNDILPTFAIGDLSDMFTTAAEIADGDPEQALFLYRQVLQLDPNYLRGRAKVIVEREQKRLHPIRLGRMLAQAYEAIDTGEWERAGRIAKDMLTLDPNNEQAEEVIVRCSRNLECEPIYQQAVAAAAKERWNAAIRFLMEVRETCPDYGDPARLYHQENIRPLFHVTTSNVRRITQRATLTGLKSYVWGVAFSPDETMLVSSSGDNTVRLWDVKSHRERASLTGHTDYVRSVGFSPDGTLLASSSDDKTLRLWDVKTRKEVAHLTGHRNAVYDMAFSPDGNLLASASLDNTVRLWDVKTRKEIECLTGHENHVYSVAFSSNGMLLASSSGDNTVRLWDVKTRKEMVRFAGHTNAAYGVAFSPDGMLLASASLDNTVGIWNVKTHKAVARLAGHRLAVYGVAFSPDGALLASASQDSTIYLWDVWTWKEIAVLKGHKGAVCSIAFSPDGALLASASEDDTIILWGLPNDLS